MEAKYPNTSPLLLLGSVVDKCWEDCSARFSQGSILCIAGCDTMRKMQKQELSKRKDHADKKLKKIEDKEVDSNGLEHKEIEHKKLPKKEIISEKIEQIQHKADELKKAANEAHQDIAKDEEEEGNSRVWTYVLWRPAMNLQGLDLGSQEDAYQTYSQLVRMVQNMMGDINIPRDPAQNGRGWRDDRMQLRLPESADTRPAALSSDGGFYSRLTESLGGVKDRVEATMAAPGFRQDLYYILIGLCGFLLLTTAFNSIFSQKSEDRQDEDHYFLSGKAAGAKLPTYEDCIKADRDLLVDINNQDSYTKGPLPTFVVLEPVAGVHSETRQREEEDNRENVA